MKTKKSRIALVANSTWNIYNFRQNVIQKLLEEGHEVFVLAPIDEFIEYKEKYPDVKHIGLRTLDRDGTNPIRDLILIEELRRKYKRIKPDLIIHYTHKPNIYGALAAALNGIRSVSMVTGLGYSFINKGWINAITKVLYGLTKRFVNMTIFENLDDRALFIKEGIVSAEKSRSVKGCGVDLNHYRPAINGFSHEKTVFTFIGRLLIDKGVREFALAAKALKGEFEDLRFVMLGDFDEENPSTIDREEFLTWINQDIIEYQGFVRDVRPFIAASDCIVLPSYREGLPRIVLEGMAMGKPIITTLTAGCRETVDDASNGFLVEAKEVNALIGGMKQFLELSYEKRKEMGSKGREKAVREFSDTIIADQIYNIISPLLHPKDDL